MYDEPPDPEPNPCPHCEAELGHGEGCDHCALASKLGSAESELSTLKHRLACRARWVAHTPFDALPSPRALEAIARITRRPADFVIGGAERPYLRRWWVIPRNRLFNVYLHQFLRSDDDRALHDHPWLTAAAAPRPSTRSSGPIAQHRSRPHDH